MTSAFCSSFARVIEILADRRFDLKARRAAADILWHLAIGIPIGTQVDLP